MNSARIVLDSRYKNRIIELSKSFVIMHLDQHTTVENNPLRSKGKLFIGYVLLYSLNRLVDIKVCVGLAFSRPNSVVQFVPIYFFHTFLSADGVVDCK